MIWLTGNKGMLGTELSLLLEKYGFSFAGTDREVDITDPAAIRDFTQAQQQPFDWIINCAAYTAVDKAEDDKENCRLLNAQTPLNIAAWANEIGAKLIHFSTDYVFNGQGSRPYTEEDAADPIGVYGLTKRDGEINILKENEKSYIIRTAWLYGRYGNNFVHTMLKLMKEKGNVSVVNDQKGSPTWTGELSETVIFLLKAVNTKAIPYGIYHFTGEGEITWFDFAKEIYNQGRALGILKKDCGVIPCTSADFPAKVKRPVYSVLDKTKIKKILGLEISDWKISLKNYMELLAEQECVN
jgi:dTDP-4-dehydrorhamnose reductase